MNLSDYALMELYDNFPLLQEILAQRSISRSEFYALSSLRPSVMNQKVYESLTWICEQVIFEPPKEIPILFPTDEESTSKV